jgi:hypothetical protein
MILNRSTHTSIADEHGIYFMPEDYLVTKFKLSNGASVNEFNLSNIK